MLLASLCHTAIRPVDYLHDVCNSHLRSCCAFAGAHQGCNNKFNNQDKRSYNHSSMCGYAKLDVSVVEL